MECRPDGLLGGSGCDNWRSGIVPEIRAQSKPQLRYLHARKRPDPRAIAKRRHLHQPIISVDVGLDFERYRSLSVGNLIQNLDIPICNAGSNALNYAS